MSSGRRMADDGLVRGSWPPNGRDMADLIASRIVIYSQI